MQRSAQCLGLSMDSEGALEVARRARGTPRIANRLLRRVRDYAEVKGMGTFVRKPLTGHSICLMLTIKALITWIESCC